MFYCPVELRPIRPKPVEGGGWDGPDVFPGCMGSWLTMVEAV